MLKAVNYTLVTLIPKTSTNTRINEYRHIFCCFTLYKSIAKVMANRLSKILSSLTDESKVAFVPGKHIQDHSLLPF
ncbi:unnamed protein product [Lathyrus sativus]|nr:unnamed protein product [Lathyrus sativus]